MINLKFPDDKHVLSSKEFRSYTILKKKKKKMKTFIHAKQKNNTHKKGFIEKII